MRRSIVVGLHAAFWITFLLFSMVTMGMACQMKPEGETPTPYFMMWLGGLLLPSIFSFYSFYSLLFPDFLQKRKPARSVLFGLLIAIGSSVFGVSFILVMSGEEALIAGSFGRILFALIIFAILGLICGIIALILKGFITWYQEIKIKDALKQKNHEMELALVKLQLDPHFLFNTINNIDVLILKNADLASTYLNKLSDIMRFMLFETKTDEILLKKELEYIEKYIELQKIRTANQSYVSYSVSGESKGKTIAPMVFIPFIENAFKHSTNKKIEDAISVEILIETDFVKLICKNKFDPDRINKTEHHGLGNDLIKKRLQLIYPDSHSLDMTCEANIYSVFLTIKNQIQ